ncbi:hypothetical protein TIFTF001_002697 [Ficus carica]|uniref:Uncharacterized protein n=1 Tax=Ficus carica TaxID=3494 RepID=A0AA87ZCR0_FICCA|nr:hypothetical protein TIFTF001_002697 [Ficus carica]
MRKRSASHDLGTFPSPGAPQYRGNGIGSQKGWASERVPRPPIASGGRQMTFNSGRTLPSKWEDAERWICSPISGYGNAISSKSLSSQPQKRPKSKSGPIVQTANGTSSVYFSNYHSPAGLEGGSLTNFAGSGSSPFSTGVLVAESIYGTGGGGPVSRLPSSILGWSELRESNGCPSPNVQLSFMF